MNETFDTIANAIAALRAELDARAAQLEAAAESQRQQNENNNVAMMDMQSNASREIERLQNEIANMPQNEANLIAQLRTDLNTMEGDRNVWRAKYEILAEIDRNADAQIAALYAERDAAVAAIAELQARIDAAQGQA